MILKIVILLIFKLYFTSIYAKIQKEIKEKGLNLEEEIMLTIWYFLKTKK